MTTRSRTQRIWRRDRNLRPVMDTNENNFNYVHFITSLSVFEFSCVFGAYQSSSSSFLAFCLHSYFTRLISHSLSIRILFFKHFYYIAGSWFKLKLLSFYIESAQTMQREPTNILAIEIAFALLPLFPFQLQNAMSYHLKIFSESCCCYFVLRSSRVCLAEW